MDSTVDIYSRLGWGPVPATLGDVRKWVNDLDEIGVPMDTKLNICSLEVEIEHGVIDKIECGDCAPQKEHRGFAIWKNHCSQVK